LELLEAMPGTDQQPLLRGGSAIIGPDTEYLAGPLFDEPGVLYAEIEPGRITEGHLFLDTQGHYARPDVFHLEVNTRAQENVSFAGEQAPVGEEKPHASQGQQIPERFTSR
jgi:nitrilase